MAHRLDRMRAMKLAAAAVMGGAITLGLGGCYWEGGPAWSDWNETYASTEWQPKSFELIDTRTGEVIWSAEVPVGKQLVVRYRRDVGLDDAVYPDLMNWEIMDAGERFGALENSIPVPGKNARRMDWYLREVPELPPGMMPARTEGSTDRPQRESLGEDDLMGGDGS